MAAYIRVRCVRTVGGPFYYLSAAIYGAKTNNNTHRSKSEICPFKEKDDDDAVEKKCSMIKSKQKNTKQKEHSESCS